MANKKNKVKQTVAKPKRKCPNAKPSECLPCKLKKLLECGESGPYNKLKNKTGKGKFDRDHVPSKAALKHYARFEINGGKKLTKKQAKAIDDAGLAIAIPKSLHQGVSPTYGARNTPDKIETDASDLRKATNDDTKKMLAAINDPQCKKKYQEFAKKVDAISNEEYHAKLEEIMKKNAPRKRKR